MKDSLAELRTRAEGLGRDNEGLRDKLAEHRELMENAERMAKEMDRRYK
jgi:hypothetical protein